MQLRNIGGQLFGGNSIEERVRHTKRKRERERGRGRDREGREKENEQESTALSGKK